MTNLFLRVHEDLLSFQKKTSHCNIRPFSMIFMLSFYSTIRVVSFYSTLLYNDTDKMIVSFQKLTRRPIFHPLILLKVPLTRMQPFFFQKHSKFSIFAKFKKILIFRQQKSQ